MNSKIKCIPMLALVLCAALFCGTAAGCSKTSDKSDSDSNPPASNVSSGTLASSEPESKAMIRPLTGKPASSEAELVARPIAVMINNVKPAFPQRGLADASVIYEMLVEGSVTRMMAVYDDAAKVPTVGSIRSARHDFVELANGLNAIFVHFGWSDSAKAAIPELGVNSINGTSDNSFFFLDEEKAKTRASEHCWYTNSELVQKGANKFSYETELKSEMPPIYNFATDGKDVMEGNTAAVSATEVSAFFSSSVSAGFGYDTDTGKYKKSQYGGAHIDENISGGFSTDNVFLMYTGAGLMSDKLHREIKLESGKGYYMSKGKAVPVTFKKSSKDDILRVYGADGNEQIVNPGSSYVCFLPEENEAKLIGIATAK